MRTFLEFREAIQPQQGADTTQIAGTVSSYRKAAALLKPLFPTATPKKHRILDYGAGLGLGTQELRTVLGPKFAVDGYEPMTGRSVVQPTYTSTDAIQTTYDGIVCLNVLNVLEPGLRQQVMHHILDLLAPNGVAVIGTRKWADDVNRADKPPNTAGKEPKSLWIQKSTPTGKQSVYQKGFDGAELAEYVRQVAGVGYEVRRVKGLAANAVVVKKRQQTEALNELFDNPTAYEWWRQDDKHWVGYFAIGEHHYVVFFDVANPAEHKWTLAFGYADHKPKLDDIRQGSVKLRFDITKTGHSTEVFATVIAMGKEFVQKVHPATIQFSASGSESRMSLYQKLATVMAPKLNFKVQVYPDNELSPERIYSMISKSPEALAIKKRGQYLRDIEDRIMRLFVKKHIYSLEDVPGGTDDQKKQRFVDILRKNFGGANIWTDELAKDIHQLSIFGNKDITFRGKSYSTYRIGNIAEYITAVMAASQENIVLPRTLTL